MFDPTGFTYNSETGEILKHGKKCGSVTKKGYLRIQNKGDRIQAHRLAWRLFYGQFPSTILDHINGNRLDNRIDNLRLSSPRLNGINKSVHRNGKLAGFTEQPNGKFRVQIWFEDKKLSLGNYKTAAEAGKVYEDALSKVLSGINPLGAEPARDFRDDIKECPYCGPDGTARHGDSEKICPECGGDHIYKSAPCRGNECESFDCEVCDSRKKPAQDDGKPKVGDIVYHEDRIRAWDYADEEMKDKYTNKAIVLMRAAEVKRRIEGARE